MYIYIVVRNGERHEKKSDEQRYFKIFEIKSFRNKS